MINATIIRKCVIRLVRCSRASFFWNQNFSSVVATLVFMKKQTNQSIVCHSFIENKPIRVSSAIHL